MTTPSVPETASTAVTGGKAVQAILIVLSLCAVAMTLVCTSRYGIGSTPDSASYLAAARSLLAGKGYLYFDNRVYTQWPPLFPTLMAILGAVGIDPMIGARILNSLAFGVTVFVSGQLFLRSTASRGFAVIGMVAVAFSVPQLTSAAMVWSEPVFTALAVSFVLLLARFLRRPSLRRLLGVAVVAALACLQRYVGVTLIMAGSVLIVLASSKASLWQRFKYVVIFGVISATPLALWLLRNRLAGAVVGGHSLHVASLPQLTRSFVVGVETLAPWFFSPLAPRSIKPIRVGLILGVAALLVVVARLWLRNRDRGQGRMTQLGTVVFVGVVYFGFLVTSAAGLGWDPEPRLTGPLYPFAMLLVVAGAEAGVRLLTAAAGGRKSVMIAGTVVCALWLVYPLTEARQTVVSCRRLGAGGYSSAQWQTSPMMQWLRNHPPDGTIYSNVPDAIYILTGLHAEISPHHYWSAEVRAKRMAESQAPNKYLVWSRYLNWDLLSDLRELMSLYDMEEIASFPDGKVYRLLGEAAGPPVYGVHRFWSPETSKHVYTADKAERDRLFKCRSQKWNYEGAAFHVYLTPEPGTVGVRRFRSASLGTEFYTIKPEECDKLTAAGSEWTDEGIVWYVYPEKVRDDLAPVYRFWSERLGYHFYTASEAEKTTLCNDTTGTWLYEGVAWYAFAEP